MDQRADAVCLDWQGRDDDERRDDASGPTA